MQNAYTILRGASNPGGVDTISPEGLLPLILSISEPIGHASKKVVDNFQRYISVVEARAGWECGWEFLDNVMGDPMKCGVLYCDVGIRNARIAQRYMMTLAAKRPSTR